MDDHSSLVPHHANIERRAFLRRAGLSIPFLYAALGELSAARAVDDMDTSPGWQSFPGVITRQKNPDNVEFPFPTLNSFLTPNEQFYIRTHFNVPELNTEQWRLSIEGHVERPVQISYDELRKMPSESLTCLLECSGNGRVFLDPPQIGIRWEQGAVGNAEWTGVPLAAVLERAGVKAGAVEVILEGHDKGKLDSPNPKSPGEIHYARSLPLEKVQGTEVLLAYQMNGEDLPPAHGYPLRAIVAGWYGMASVKWLKRIIVTDQKFQGFFQTFMYTTWDRSHGGVPTLVPVADIDVKSQIARPALHEVVPAGSDYEVHGAAWAGKNKIEKVDVSADGGQTWSPAMLDEQSVAYAWRFWRFTWQTPMQAGRHILMARATDEMGRVQPLKRDPDRRDAMITHVQPIEVYVR